MSLSQQNFVLMKFFPTAEYKQAFLNGQIFCNTPAYYRKSNKNGVGDRCESAISSHYNGYEQEDGIGLEIGIGEKIGENKLNLSNITAFILRQSGEVDSWLHCWYLLEVETNAPDTTIYNLERMSREFGEHAVLLKTDNFAEFLERINKHSTKEVKCCVVKYTDELLKVSKSCKLRALSY